VSPPSDSPSAASGVLDPPPDGDIGPSVPIARWSEPDEDYWLDEGIPFDPIARSGLPVLEPRTLSGKARRHGAHSAKVLRKSRFTYPTRRWPRRILISANLVVGLLLLSTASTYGYFDWRINQIKRVVIPSLVGGTRPAIKAAAVPVAPPGAPMTILVVGSDSRAGDTGGDAHQFGNSAAVGGQRSDTIMLLHLVPATTSATLLSLPRDLWVPIAGTHSSNRINSAFNNGPDQLVQTIEKDLGIPIDHYIEVDFQSFRDIVNAVGGVNEYFAVPARDSYSLLNIPRPGCYTMTGNMALSFVRSRHYEYKVNGRWVYEAESDLARIQRQQSFIKKMITKAQGEGLSNPLELNGVIGGITTNLTLDSGFSQSLLLTLAERYRNISPGNLPTTTLPTTATVIGGADVLLLQQPEARQTIASFLNPKPPASRATATTSTTTPAPVSTVAPSTVRVAVLNGSGRTGEAGTTRAALSRQGFVVTSDGSASNFNYTTSEVLYGPGSEAKAQLVASSVEGGAQVQSDPTLQGADVELITGQSYQGISAVSANGTPVPTTAPPTTTTTIYQLPGTPAGFVPPVTCQ
jgi:polyisoprenyl-teichoic acid--peptidoglycan teichoic acid transferase